MRPFMLLDGIHRLVQPKQENGGRPHRGGEGQTGFVASVRQAFQERNRKDYGVEVDCP